MIKGRTALPYAPGDDQDRRRAGRADRARRAPERVPGRHPAAGLDPRLPLRRDGRAGARLRRPGLRSRARSCALSRASSRARSSARKGSSTTTTATCAAAPGVQRVEVNAAGYPVADAPAPTPPTAATASRRRSTSACRREGEKALLRGDRTRARGRQTGRPRARSWRWTRATAQCSRSAPTRASTRTSSPNR